MFDKMYMYGYDYGYLAAMGGPNMVKFVNPYEKDSNEYNACEEGFNDGFHDGTSDGD